MNRRKLWREWWLSFHRWMGLLAGGVLVLVGLTGSLYVFSREIRSLLDPATQRVEASALGRSAYRPWGEILTAAEGQKPAGTVLSGLGGPLTATESAHVFFTAPGTNASTVDFHELCYDPYTGRFLGASRLEQRWEWNVCEFLFQLHFSLALQEVGVRIVGVVAIIGILSIFSGLYLWWPSFGRLRHALTIHRKGAGIRQRYDMHRVVGFYFSLALGAVLLSGTWMNFNSQFLTVVKALSPGTQAGEPEIPVPRGIANEGPPNWIPLISRIRDQFPDGYMNWVSVPTEPSGTLVFSFVEVPGSSVSRWSERMVYVDGESGLVQRVDDPVRRRTRGEGFLAWQWPLHSGRAFGWAGRGVVFLTGWVPLVLYVTGVRIWWHKRKARARHTGLKPSVS